MEPIVIKDQSFFDVSEGGVAFTLKARDYKAPQTVAYIANSSGGGISGTVDAHYYKGCGEREGTEREFIVCKKLKSATQKSDFLNGMKTT